MAISVGDKVEISSKEEGFLGSFFEAKVLAKKGQHLLVQYKTIVSEKDENVFLKEVVKDQTVRPLPPEISVSEFNVFEKVDAYENDGWWEGRIMKKRGSNYAVYFETSGELLDFPSSRLRLHQDYVDGDWVRSSEKYTVFRDVKLLRCQ